jgi:hypothetical protein
MVKQLCRAKVIESVTVNRKKWSKKFGFGVFLDIFANRKLSINE